MEVVGLVGALSGLIDLIHKVIQLAQALRKTKYTNAVEGVESELGPFEEVLENLSKSLRVQEASRWEHKHTQEIIQEARGYVASLRALLKNATEASAKWNAYKRANLFLGGFDKQLKANLDRIHGIRMLIVAKQVDAMAQQVNAMAQQVDAMAQQVDKMEGAAIELAVGTQLIHVYFLRSY
jgi:uncharacterized coiled-coil DUF342 family protein